MRSVGLLVLVAAAGCVGQAPDDPSANESRQDAEDDAETGAGNGENQTSITPSGYLRKIAEIQCEQAYSCRGSYTGTNFEATWKTSLPACATHWFMAWNPAGLENEISKGRVTFDGTAAVACLGGVAFGECGEYWMRGIQWGEPCYHVMVGSVPAGETCDTGYACESGDCDLTVHRCM